MQIIIEAVQKNFDKVAQAQSTMEKFGVSVGQMQKGLAAMGVTFDQTTGHMISAKGEWMDEDKALKQAASSTKGFRMEMLSLMFGAMQAGRMFGFLNKQINQMYFSSQLAQIQLEMISGMDIFLQPLSDWASSAVDAFSDLPDPVKGVAGGVFTLASAAADAVAFGAQLTLFMEGWNKAKLGTKIVKFARSGWNLITDAWDFINSKFIDKIYTATIKPIITGLQLLATQFEIWLAKQNALAKIAIKVGFAIAAIELGIIIGKYFAQALEHAFPGIGAKFKEMIDKYMPLLGKILLGWGAIFDIMSGGNFLKDIRESVAPGMSADEFRRSLGSRQGGGPISATGMYRLHQGEYVIPKGGGGVINFSPTINITAGGVSSSADMRSLANQLAEHMRLDLKRMIN